ncbi:Mediator of RNA polymerase II transcription subunit 7 [Ataeniobius toweri]|uniref:Mediator of RNA polymerase II transcription subunit 7 n=1 Tax=Ataeniobius toweri TaxID=208326 RepID=A0ABU7BE81_9TELE|nr:Mediator of RNA polymerase II transcription subunit 7 [Ataeniobius toweri]
MVEPQQASALPLLLKKYIKEYTDENKTKPPPPIRDSYIMFQYDDLIIRPLESHGNEWLYLMQFDHQWEFKKLNMSIVVNLLDLLDILIKSPGSIKREEKQKDTQILSVRMHHLINEGDDGGAEELEAGNDREVEQHTGDSHMQSAVCWENNIVLNPPSP